MYSVDSSTLGVSVIIYAPPFILLSYLKNACVFCEEWVVDLSSFAWHLNINSFSFIFNFKYLFLEQSELNIIHVNLLFIFDISIFPISRRLWMLHVQKANIWHWKSLKNTLRYPGIELLSLFNNLPMSCFLSLHKVDFICKC